MKLSGFQLFSDIIIDYGLDQIDLSNKSEVITKISQKNDTFDNILDNFISLINNLENKEVEVLCYNMIDKTFKTSAIIPNRFWE